MVKQNFIKKVLRYYNGKAIIKHRTNSPRFFSYMSQFLIYDSNVRLLKEMENNADMLDGMFDGMYEDD